MRYIIVLEVPNEDMKDIVVAVNSDPAITIRQVIPYGSSPPYSIGNGLPPAASPPKQKTVRPRVKTLKSKSIAIYHRRLAKRYWQQQIQSVMKPGVEYDVSKENVLGITSIDDGVTLLAPRSLENSLRELKKLGYVTYLGRSKYKLADSE